MNCFSRLSSCILGRTSHFLATRTTNASNQSRIPFWKRSFEQSGLHLEFLSTRFRIQCYSSRKPSLKASIRKKKDSQPTTVMDHEKDAIFFVRKGDVVGVYKNFADCEAQLGTSILDPPVSVYKGYSLSKDSEAYLVSHGLQNALYTIRAADLKEDLFGKLIPCPFQQPASSNAATCPNDANKKRSQEILGSEIKGIDGSASITLKHNKLDIQAECQAQSSNSVRGSKTMDDQLVKTSKFLFLCIHGTKKTLIFYSQKSCLLEFDGASKGNPGQAGAGAVLRNDDGSLICRLREGLGIATNNMAEYRAILLGMKYALEKGYTKIHVKGDSKLVCMQIEGSWKARHENITNLYEEAKKLKNSFLSFHISHVPREYNSEADSQANLAVRLAGSLSVADGEVQEEFE
ncbi:hypothetical protein POTOM_030134 [Populus tomentosa]|uniref:RNase H type-1 domain-containing protein n=1 Tax=Populus tomentosa TaxID=118781 RepID=A0A8X8CUM7_POPTO|nr:hypothetical protein POTOM_030134 [Populus tomentosa]